MKTKKLLILTALAFCKPLMSEVLHKRESAGYTIVQERSASQGRRECAAHATFNALSVFINGNEKNNSSLLTEIKTLIPIDSHSGQIVNYLKSRKGITPEIKSEGLPGILRHQRSGVSIVVLDSDFMCLLEDTRNFFKGQESQSFIDDTGEFVNYLSSISSQEKKTVFIYHILDHWISFQVEMQNGNCVVTVLDSTNSKVIDDKAFDFFALLKMGKPEDACELAKAVFNKQAKSNDLQCSYDFRASQSSSSIHTVSLPSSFTSSTNFSSRPDSNDDTHSFSTLSDSSSDEKLETQEISDESLFIFGGITFAVLSVLCFLKKSKKRFIKRWKTKFEKLNFNIFKRPKFKAKN